MIPQDLARARLDWVYAQVYAAHEKYGTEDWRAQRIAAPDQANDPLDSLVPMDGYPLNRLLDPSVIPS